MAKLKLALRLSQLILWLLLIAVAAVQLYELVVTSPETAPLPQIRADSAEQLCRAAAATVQQELAFTERLVLAVAALWALEPVGLARTATSPRPLCLDTLTACAAEPAFALNLSATAQARFAAQSGAAPQFITDFFLVFTSGMVPAAPAVITRVFDAPRLALLNAAAMEGLRAYLEAAGPEPLALRGFHLLARSTRVNPDAVSTRYLLRSSLPFRDEPAQQAAPAFASVLDAAGAALTVHAAYSPTGELNRDGRVRARLRTAVARLARSHSRLRVLSRRRPPRVGRECVRRCARGVRGERGRVRLPRGAVLPR